MDNRSSVINELPNHNMNNQFGNMQQNDLQNQQIIQQQMQQQQMQQQQMQQQVPNNSNQEVGGNYLAQDNDMVKDIINEINETDNLNNNAQENFTNNKKKKMKKFYDKTLKQLLPFFGFIIYFLLSLSQTRSIFKKLPKGMNKSNQISMIGLLYQGFVGIIIFHIK